MATTAIASATADNTVARRGAGAIPPVTVARGGVAEPGTAAPRADACGAVVDIPHVLQTVAAPTGLPHLPQ